MQYPRTKRITRPRLDLEVANSFKVWAAVFCLDLEMDRILDLRISCFEFRLDTGKLAIDEDAKFGRIPHIWPKIRARYRICLVNYQEGYLFGYPKKFGYPAKPR